MTSLRLIKLRTSRTSVKLELLNCGLSSNKFEEYNIVKIERFLRANLTSLKSMGKKNSRVDK